MTRVVCAGLDPLRDELTSQLDDAPGVENLGSVDDFAGAPAADVAIVAEPDPAAARSLVSAALERGFAVVLVTHELGWVKGGELGELALRAGRTLLAYGRTTAFVGELLPALLSLACVRVDRVEVELAGTGGSTGGAALLRLHGEPSLEIQVSGAVTGDRALAALTVNAIPLVLTARPGLQTLADIPAVSARHAEAREPV